MCVEGVEYQQIIPIALVDTSTVVRPGICQELISRQTGIMYPSALRQASYASALRGEMRRFGVNHITNVKFTSPNLAN